MRTIIQSNVEEVKSEPKKFRRKSVDATLNTIVGNKCLWPVEAIGEIYPEALYRRHMANFTRNACTMGPAIEEKKSAIFSR